MKVLLLSPLPPPAGGIATWTEKYCESMNSKGHSVSLVNTTIVGRRAAGASGKRLIDELVRAVRIIKNTYRVLCKEDVDCVHINSSCSAFGLLRDLLCSLMAKKRPVLLHCHCNVEDQVGQSRLGKRLFVLLAKKADCVLVLNERSLHYVQKLGCTKAKILPNFIDLDAITPARTTRENISKILFVGHIRKEKGLFELLEAAVALPEITFELVGPVYENLDGNSIPRNVHLLGMQPKMAMPSFLIDADVFLFPSYSEGFSMALLEAMAAGLPAIATDVGANRDMLEDQGGVLIPTKDAQAIVAAVKKLQSRPVRVSMAAWNQEKVKATYTVDRVVRQLLDMMWELSI